MCKRREFLIDVALGAFDLESGLRSSFNERISVVSLGKRKCIMQPHQETRLLGRFYETRVILLTKLDDNYGAGRVWITFLFTLYFFTFCEREKWHV